MTRLGGRQRFRMRDGGANMASAKTSGESSLSLENRDVTASKLKWLCAQVQERDHDSSSLVSS